MRIPFFLMRFAMAAAVLAVIGLVVWLLMQDDKRDVSDGSRNNNTSAGANRTEQTDLASGNVNELLIRLNQLPAPPEEAPYIVQATRFQDRLEVLESLTDKMDNLDDATAMIVKRGLLGTLYQLHSINRFEQVDDKNIYKELQTCANQLANDDNDEIRRTANVTRTAISVLDVFDLDPRENEVENAKSAINQLLNDFPKSKNTYGTLYRLITDYGSKRNAYDDTLTLLKHVNGHAHQSDDEEVERLGNTYSGRVMLIENDVLNLRGQLDLQPGSDGQALVRNLQNFFSADFPLTLQIADAIGKIANGLEKLQKNESALTIYRLLDERTRSNQQLEPVAELAAAGLKRLESKGNRVDFPDVVEGQANLVVFVSDSNESIQSIRELANIRILNSRTKLKLILVSLDQDAQPIQKFLDENRLRELTLVKDPDKKSSYYKAYPAAFFPTVILVGADGTILAANINRKRLKELLDEISESS